jgi:hypothetical protein
MRPKRRRKRGPKVLFPLYVDPGIFPRLERIAAGYRELLPGARITRHDACRAALSVGVDDIETKLGLKKEPAGEQQ